MHEYRINKFLSLRLEYGQTYIYVNNEPFITCVHLLINIPSQDISKYDEIDSIDEAQEIMNYAHYHSEPIPRETEFWGHCSNLQAWVENNYDTRILHRSLSFQLLKKLTEVGDPVASKVFREEIAKRFMSGHSTIIYYLLEEGYLDYLSDYEFETVIKSLNIEPDSKFGRLISEYNETFWLRTGVVYLKSGEEREGLEIFKRVLDDNPTEVKSWIKFNHKTYGHNNLKKFLKKLIGVPPFDRIYRAYEFYHDHLNSYNLEEYYYQPVDAIDLEDPILYDELEEESEDYFYDSIEDYTKTSRRLKSKPIRLGGQRKG